MNNIDTRAPFFPHSRSSKASQAKAAQALKGNTFERAQQIKENTSGDAKVNISTAIKDFARIKKAVDATDTIDNTDKIASLKARIQAGTYEPDYDAIADKMLSSEL